MIDEEDEKLLNDLKLFEKSSFANEKLPDEMNAEIKERVSLVGSFIVFAEDLKNKGTDAQSIVRQTNFVHHRAMVLLKLRSKQHALQQVSFTVATWPTPTSGPIVGGLHELKINGNNPVIFPCRVDLV